LERNKQLLAKTQAFESFVAECDEKVSTTMFKGAVIKVLSGFMVSHGK